MSNSWDKAIVKFLTSPVGTACAAAFLMVNLLLLIVTGPPLFDLFSRIPPSIATLVVGVVGFAVVAWQTKRGLRHLIAAQEHRADIEKQARDHQLSIELVRRDDEEQRAKRILSAALRGELLAEWHNRRNAFLVYSAGALTYAKSNERGDDVLVRSLRHTSPLIYEASVEKLGLFGPSICSDIVTVYSDIVAGTEDKDMNIAPKFAKAAYDLLARTAEYQMEDIMRVIARLHASEHGGSDPGPLSELRAAREKSAIAGVKAAIQQ